MNKFVKVLNHPTETFEKEYKIISWELVIITILINAVFEPCLRFFLGRNHAHLEMLYMIRLIIFGILCYVFFCFFIWSVCRFLGSKKTLFDYINTWGISYVPTAICALIVVITEVFFYIFWDNIIYGMILNATLIGLLIWKTILYYAYLKKFANLKGIRLYLAFIIIGIIILIMAAICGYLGLKTPVL